MESYNTMESAAIAAVWQSPRLQQMRTSTTATVKDTKTEGKISCLPLKGLR